MANRQLHWADNCSIDYNHYAVHDGLYYDAFAYAQTLANNGNLDVMIDTTSTAEAHFTFSVQVGGSCFMQLIENMTCNTSVPGTNTAITVINLNRNSANEAKTKFYYLTSTAGYSAAASTLTIGAFFMPGGNSPTTRIGGSESRDTEIILKQSTKYLLRLTNVSGATITANISFEFYEEEE